MRGELDYLTASIEARHLFPQKPTIQFRPSVLECSCSGEVQVAKAWKHTVATLDIGEFTAHETMMNCSKCSKSYPSEELRQLVPDRCKFGFDVITFVGKAVFLECRNEQAVRAELLKRNIKISLNGVGYLAKKFVVYLGIAHRESSGKIKQRLQENGGYLLHLDSTVEGDSPHLMTGLDEISDFILGSVKIRSEKAEYVTRFLEETKRRFGAPLSVTRDMSAGIGSAVAKVFPGIREYICHYHFLRDLGKDLFGAEYQTLRNRFKALRIRTSLTALAAKLRKKIEKQSQLKACLNNYLDKQQNGIPNEKLLPEVSAYLLVMWILDAKRHLKGYGFPFDREYLDYFIRMEEVNDALKKLRPLRSTQKGLVELDILIRKAFRDCTLLRAAAILKQKCAVFDRLREAMRIALPQDNKSLNDDGDYENIKTIEERVKQFRYNEKIVAKAASQPGYKKMLEQIDKYWTKLFADPIEITTSQGKILIQPQRTNNSIERTFRGFKRNARSRTGNLSLSRTLKAMIADTLLLKNLENPSYMDIILGGCDSLEQRFAQIDAKLVKKEIEKAKEPLEKISLKFKKTLELSQLPGMILQKPNSWANTCQNSNGLL